MKNDYVVFVYKEKCAKHTYWYMRQWA